MKPLKDTRIGKFLAGKNLDYLVEGVGELVPPLRLLERVKDIALGERSHLDEEQKKQFLELYRLDLESYDKENDDRAGARTREKEFVAAAGHIDWFMTIFGLVILMCFVFTTIVSAWGNIPVEMREIFIEGRAAVRDIVIAIATYYWGSSAGSRMKEMRRMKNEE